MKTLLVATAGMEGITGVALLASPALPISILLGTPFDSPTGVVVAQVAGAALIALALACWRARGDSRGRAAGGLVVALLVYNVATVVILTHAHVGTGLGGIGLWPAVILHVGMAVWCAASLQQK